MMIPIDLKGKISVVVGGVGDIGSKISEVLAQSGSNVIITDLDQKSGKVLSSKLNQQFDISSPFYRCDLTIRKEVSSTVDKILDKYGRIDNIIYAAGYASFAEFTDLTDKEWEKSMAVNLYGAFYFIQEAISDMLSRKKGNIIIIGSTTTINGSGGGAHYAVSKTGLLGILKSLTYDLLPKGIRINIVSPGVIDTKMLRIRYPDTPEVNQKITEGIPLGRMGEPIDIANIVLFLASDLSEYICGQEIIADGGRIIYRRPK
jgi:3-oxoacyl-[acyl-carrier protein] reductase